MTAVRRIALVGLPGSGKSTVAPLLAEHLGWRCVDLDDEVTQTSGRTPASILAVDGEAAFRAIELTALVGVLGRPESMVIACGGGLITGSAARSALTEQ